MFTSRNPKPRVFTATLLLLGVCAGVLQGQGVILHLRNGDRISGKILNETTNHVVVQSSWHNVLVLPVSEITSRQVTPKEGAGVVAAQPPQVPATIAVTPVPVLKPVEPKKPKVWSTELQVGVDLLFSERERQLFSGRWKTSYLKEPLRATFDYQAAYGKTDGLLSDDRMFGSLKTDWDFRKKYYVYNLAGAGFDHVRKINLRYEEGPGLGLRLFTQPGFLVNLEAGGNFQAQYYSDDTKTESFFFRLAEDITWKITPKISWDEKFEFFPKVDEWDQYRFRFETNFRYALLTNLSLIITVLDQYDTMPASGIPQNTLQLTSSIGIRF